MIRSFIVTVCIFASVNVVFGQIKDSKKDGAELDSLRKIEESSEDSVVFDSKYIRYTTLNLLADSTQTIPLDTSAYNFQNYNPLYQPESPTINLGSTGLAYRNLLFTPTKSIGFDAGFHSLDTYLLTPQNIRYYRARTPFTELYYMNGTLKEQFFKVLHSQNIKPNWNIGANYNRIVGEGFYKNQHADHLNAAVFSWYESNNKRYNLLSNIVFNTIKAAENGALINPNPFTEPSNFAGAESVKLNGTGPNRPQQTWRSNSIFLKQFYYLGRVDTLNKSADAGILPTQRVSHSLTYTSSRYKFFRNELDENHVFPVLADSILTNDSTQVKNFRNEFGYSFYLRGKALSFIKNELKLDLALQHDLYVYRQTNNVTAHEYKSTFQNITLKAGLGYRFSDRINIEGDLQQIAQGRNAGDFLYDAKTYFLVSKSVGKIVLGAYLQNKSPEQMYERVSYQLHKWSGLNFDRTKISNLSFSYENPKFRFSAKADYFLINKYLYYKEAAQARQIEPAQFGTNINMIKVSVGEHIKFRKFNWETYVVYQKTDFASILRTPEVYTYNSVYYNTRIFKVLNTSLGFDVRYNTPFQSPAYAINVSQFYNDNAALDFSTYPIVDVWVRANLKRSNLFLKYDYANQGMQSKGFYTVNRYPMFNSLLKFGVSWNFYN